MRFNCRGETKETVDKITNLNYIDESFVLYENQDYMKIKDLSKINEIPYMELLEDAYYDEEIGV